MGLSQTTLRPGRKGFSLLEVLVSITVSSLLLTVIALLFRVGSWELQRSSGRIEMVRRGRLAIDNVQKFLSSAVAPGGAVFGSREAVTFPVNLGPDPESRVQFYTAKDHLVDLTRPGARELQTNPRYFSYELASIPAESNLGMDIVLRKYLIPANASDDPVLPDTSVRPRVLARGLGIPDPESPTGYSDGLVIRHQRLGAVELDVNVSSDLISDDVQRTKIEARTPLRIKMRSIYQLPFYNIQ